MLPLLVMLTGIAGIDPVANVCGVGDHGCEAE
jgi:hypothetical protein